MIYERAAPAKGAAFFVEAILCGPQLRITVAAIRPLRGLKVAQGPFEALQNTRDQTPFQHLVP